MKTITPLPVLLQSFFTDRLMAQRGASPHTLASYRDTFRLLLHFAQSQLRKPPSALALEDLDAPFIGAFLDHLEKTRHNSARSRNLRLAALRSFFRYVSFQEPGQSNHIQRVLAIPTKRHDRPLIDFLTRPEINALLAAPDTKTWAGRRDYALLLLALQTGLRLSELIGLRREDIVLGAGAHIRCQGKGRKERCTPLTRQTRVVLQAWLEKREGLLNDIVFPNRYGGRFSPDGIQYLVAKHVRTAQGICPSLKRKRVSPHVMRHTTAMELLQSGVDRSMIALWLGHESVETTQIYLDANLAIKEELLAKTTPIPGKVIRYKPADRLLEFLQAL